MALSLLNASVASMARMPGGRFHDVKEKLWGIKLTKEKPEATWNPEVLDDENGEQRHNLLLQRCLLGVEAKPKERNMVEVVTKNIDGDDIASPIFSLTLGKNDQSSLGLNFGSPDSPEDSMEPVVFRLAAGTGPVHLIGIQMSETMKDVDFNETDDLDEEEDDLDDEPEPLPKKVVKKK